MPQYNAKKFIPHADKVFVTSLEKGARKSSGGIIIMDDDMKDVGIRSRWGKVWAVGANVDEVKVGEWVLIEHGRWTYGIDLDVDGEDVTIWHIDLAAVLVATDDDPRLTMLDAR